MKKVVKFFSIFLLSFLFAFSGCMYTSPEAAMEGIGIGHSQRERIEADGCYFYYTTVSYHVENAGELGDWICEVTPVQKNEIGMWHATVDPRSYVVHAEGGSETVAYLVTEEVNGIYHNFLIPEFQWEEEVSLPDGIPSDYAFVHVHGKDVEIFKHSYFVTYAEVKEFTLSGIKFTVGAET